MLSRYVDAIVIRTFGQDRIEALAGASSVPVVNALTDAYHPCQVLADLQTVQERRGTLAGLTLTYLGDGANNMAHCLLLGGAMAGMHVRVGAPEGYQPDPAVVERARAYGTDVARHRPTRGEAARGRGRAVHRRLGLDGPDRRRAAAARPRAVRPRRAPPSPPPATPSCCTACPPTAARRSPPSVLDGPQSAVWDEAENRLHAQKALLTWLLQQA